MLQLLPFASGNAVDAIGGWWYCQVYISNFNSKCSPTFYKIHFDVFTYVALTLIAFDDMWLRSWMNTEHQTYEMNLIFLLYFNLLMWIKNDIFFDLDIKIDPSLWATLDSCVID